MRDDLECYAGPYAAVYCSRCAEEKLFNIARILKSIDEVRATSLRASPTLTMSLSPHTRSAPERCHIAEPTDKRSPIEHQLSI